jgi:serine/threonine-protein kinase RsbW
LVGTYNTSHPPGLDGYDVPAPMTSRPPGRHACVPLAAAAVGQIAEALEAFCAAEEIPEDTAWRLKVVIDEIVTNIVSHGDPVDPGASIDVWFERHGETVEVRVADDGAAFDPMSQPAPDLSAPLEDRRPGGLGIALVRGLMDDVRYERTSRNILLVRKRIDTGSASGATGVS